MGFLGLCELVGKERHKAATRNSVPQGMEEHDIFPLKRYFIMFVRGTPCSSWVCVSWSVRNAIGLALYYLGSQKLCLTLYGDASIVNGDRLDSYMAVVRQ